MKRVLDITKMTTLIGIATDGEKKGIVLGSDSRRTHQEWKQQGDIAYKVQTQREAQKIYVDEKREVAVTMTGVVDPNYTEFLTGILNGSINVKEAIEKGYFADLNELNLRRWEFKLPNIENSNALLLATRYENDPQLHTCYPLGAIERRAWTSIGSGEEHAINYILSQAVSVPALNPPNITLAQGVDLAYQGLKEASQDIYTGGLDLVVIGEEKIIEFGEKIKTSLDNAEQKTITNIRNSL
ncbi:hypothetical protein CL617_02955 [archaeon]|nr:hypothetical protein [archaeon]